MVSQAHEPEYPEPRDDQTDAETRDEILLDTETLFQGKQEIHIQHEGQLYHLRITRNGRLILNK